MYTAESELAAPPASPAEAGRRWSRADWIALLVTLALLALVCFGQSAMKLFWYDELITLRISGMHSLGDIFRFYESGKDTTSFLPAMLVYFFKRLPGRPELTTRIPFTLSYLVTCLCMWVFMRRRYAPGYAVAAVLLFAQGWTVLFASEIRAYSFILMGAAIAVACWQAANEEGPLRNLATAGVFAGLAIAILFHFFAIFLVVPFALAEWSYRRTTGRTRIGMWLAILLHPLAVSIMLPNMLAARSLYGGSFWSKPSIVLLTDCYVVFLQPFGRVFPELTLLFVVLFWLTRRRGGSAIRDLVQSGGFSVPEWVLLMGMAFVPVFAFIGSKFLGAYRTQYVLYFQIGMMLLVIGALGEILRRRKGAGWGLALVTLLMFFVHFHENMQQAFVAMTGPATSILPTEYDPAWADYLKGVPLPIVAEGADTLMVALQYTPPEVQQRLLLLTSHQRALLQPKSMTNELNMEIFGHILNLPVQDYDGFVANHKDFLILVNPAQLEWTWVFRSLMEESQKQHDVQLRLLWGADPTDGDQVYLVHFGPAPEAIPGT